MTNIILGFPSGSDGKESACNAEDPGSVPGLGRSPGEGNVYPIQYSCLDNSLERSLTGPRGCKVLISYLFYTHSQLYIYVNSNLPILPSPSFPFGIQIFKLVLEKVEEPEIKLPTSAGSWKKEESSRKTSISALLTMPKPLTVWITIMDREACCCCCC